MSEPTALIFAFTIILSPVAGVIAYLITYDEYIHHLSKADTKKQALQMAIFTFIVFIVVGLVSGWIFNQFINK